MIDFCFPNGMLNNMYKHKINVVFNGMKYERMKGCSILRLSTFSYGPIISEMPHYIFFLLVNIVFTMQILLHTLNLKKMQYDSI